MSKFVIDVDNVWKRYYLHNNRPWSLKSALLSRFNYWSTREEFWALQGVNLKIEKGRTVGLIGNNGAGKSTLLRLISGLSRPTRGRIERQGRLGSLLELGAGFNAEFTGRENVITGSILAGQTRQEALENLEKVIKFAELEDFVDSPVRTYSSGMFVRLAFSTQINLDPDILLVDEVLAVGDLGFQKKCINHLLEMKKQGKTIVVVSHSMSQIQAICDEVVWLEHGRVRTQGPTREIIGQYQNRIFEKASQVVTAAQSRHAKDLQSKKEILLNGLLAGSGENNAVATLDEIDSSENGKTALPTAPRRDQRQGSQEIEIKSATLLDENGDPVKKLTSGEPLILHVNYKAFERIEQPIFQVCLLNDENIKCYEISTEGDGAFLGQVEGDGYFNLSFGSLPLLRGNYYFSVGAYSQNWERIFDYKSKLCNLLIEGETPGEGVIFPPHRWQV
ncbi:MAG TPA: ABC transporter ATP-binding protein [Chloroflexia bacterium]|nr:ABC transporter ATP-binding protein [Chloroflexia bacterium]